MQEQCPAQDEKIAALPFRTNTAEPGRSRALPEPCPAALLLPYTLGVSAPLLLAMLRRAERSSLRILHSADPRELR